MSFTARTNSARSVPTWEPSPASSRPRGAASRPRSRKPDQAWLLNQAAFRLRALGRLTEALEPMRAGLDMRVNQEDWENAGASASNLSELELTLGEVGGAVRDAEQSVSHADHSGDAFQRMGKRTRLADALHQAGRRAEAEARFREAEEMQAERQPDYPLLYSWQGFAYCDLLSTEAERAAWRVVCSGGLRPPEDGDTHRATLQTVSERGQTALSIVLNGSRNLPSTSVSTTSPWVALRPTRRFWRVRHSTLAARPSCTP